MRKMQEIMVVYGVNGQRTASCWHMDVFPVAGVPVTRMFGPRVILLLESVKTIG